MEDSFIACENDGQLSFGFFVVTRPAFQLIQYCANLNNASRSAKKKNIPIG